MYTRTRLQLAHWLMQSFAAVENLNFSVDSVMSFRISELSRFRFKQQNDSEV